MAGGTLGLPAGLPSTEAIEAQPEYESGEPESTGTHINSAFGPDDDAALVRWINKEVTLAETSHISAQREAMREADRFQHSHQLSDADMAKLAADRRPDTVVNEVQKFIRFASGIERRSPTALIFAARTMEDEKASILGEQVTKQYEWFCDQSQANFARSEAFEHRLVGGIGCLDYGLTRVTNPAGAPRCNVVDPHELLWPQSSKQNLGLGTATPVRWMARESHMDVDEAVHKWPDYALFLRAAAGGEDSHNDQFPDFGYGAKKAIPYVVPWIMTVPVNKTGGGGKEGAKPGKVPILEFQHYDDEQGYYFFDPLQKDDAWLSNSDFRKYRVRLKQLYQLDITDYDPKQYHRVYKRSFLLQRRILLDGPDPLPTQQAGYTWNVMTGMWDRTDKVFYGLIRVLIAPQRYSNAMFRQVLEIMGASTKGGYLAETGAITNAQKDDIVESGARPGSVNMVQAGAISGGKIMPKPIPQLPQGSMEVLGFCIDLMEKLNGLSTSLIGADQSNTPGVALRKRLTNGMILLAAEFDSLNRFRKREGMLTFELMKLLADDRLIRIGGPFDGQTVKFTKDPFALEYDITLDENEQDPNLRQYYTEQITAIAPILIRTGNFFPELLDYINLPAQFRQRLKQGMQQMEQQKQQMTMQGLSVGGRGKPRSLEEIQAQVGLTKARAAKDMAQARATMVKPLQEGMRSIFDMQRAKHEQGMKEKQLSLEALQALFDGLQAAQSGNPPKKEKR